MSRPRSNPIIQATHFAWRLYRRSGVFYADGRSKGFALGRHSLNTRDETEARLRLAELDQHKAAELSLIPAPEPAAAAPKFLTLEEGRRLYETHNSRPRVTGGIKASTAKTYKDDLDKFVPWCQGRKVMYWNGVTAPLLTDFATFLLAGGKQKKAYAEKTVSDALTTVKQAIKWLIKAGHLPGMEPIDLPLSKPTMQRAYCWRPEEVAAMVELCATNGRLRWLGDIVVGLACTGLRISEFASLKWSDINLELQRLSLTNEVAAGRDLKTKASVREFPVHPDFLAVLQRRERRSQYVFLGPRGGRLKPDFVRRKLISHVLAPLLERFPKVEGVQGFADGRLHSFRHYFASTCANNRVPEPMLMRWLGHRDSEMVRYYYHVYDAEARRQMNSIEFLGNSANGHATSEEQKGGNADDQTSV